MAKFGFVQLREFVSPRRVAFETLRLGTIMFFAPVALGFAFLRSLRATHAALFLRDSMFNTPPAVVIVPGFLFIVIVVRTVRRPAKEMTEIKESILVDNDPEELIVS